MQKPYSFQSVKFKTLFSFSFILLFLFSLTPVLAKEPPKNGKKAKTSNAKTAKIATPIPLKPVSRFNFVQAQVGPVAAFQGGGSSYSLLGRYLPEYSMGRYALGLDVGFSSFSLAGGVTFLMSEFGVQGAYRINPIWNIRVLLGAQSWSGNNGTAFFVSPIAEYHFSHKLLRVIDGLYFAYSPVFQKKTAQLISFGVNLNF